MCRLIENKRLFFAFTKINDDNAFALIALILLIKKMKKKKRIQNLENNF